MKILVAEYITGGGFAGVALPLSLAREGRLMRKALLDDLLLANGVSELQVMNDTRIPEEPADSRLRWLPVTGIDSYANCWREGLARCDAVWLVAPETGDLLGGLSAEAEEAGCRLLSNPARAVRLAGSKAATLERLRAHGLPVVEHLPLTDYRSLIKKGRLPWVAPSLLKPDDGVGCEYIRIFSHPDELGVPDGAAFIVQPLLEGEPLSLSALFAAGEAHLLTVNRQMIEPHGDGFVLSACVVNALSDADGRWQALATDIARAVPELWGYAGVDLISTGEGPRILEINPRLTTSYAGIRRATGVNPAAVVLDLARGGSLPAPSPVRNVAVEISLRDAHAH